MNTTQTIDVSRLGLRPEILDKIKEDSILFGRVANAIGVKRRTLDKFLSENNRKLTFPECLILLSKELGVQYTDLLTELQTAA